MYPQMYINRKRRLDKIKKNSQNLAPIHLVVSHHSACRFFFFSKYHHEVIRRIHRGIPKILNVSRLRASSLSKLNVDMSRVQGLILEAWIVTGYRRQASAARRTYLQTPHKRRKETLYRHPMPKPKSSNNRAHEQSKGQRTKTAAKSIQKQEENRKNGQ
jgi:hypothetical protein